MIIISKEDLKKAIWELLNERELIIEVTGKNEIQQLKTEIGLLKAEQQNTTELSIENKRLRRCLTAQKGLFTKVKNKSFQNYLNELSKKPKKK